MRFVAASRECTCRKSRTRRSRDGALSIPHATASRTTAAGLSFRGRRCANPGYPRPESRLTSGAAVASASWEGGSGIGRAVAGTRYTAVLVDFVRAKYQESILCADEIGLAHARSHIRNSASSGHYSFASDEARVALSVSANATKLALNRLNHEEEIASPAGGFNVIISPNVDPSAACPPTNSPFMAHRSIALR